MMKYVNGKLIDVAPAVNSDSDTTAPKPDDFVEEWDEWSEVDKGAGPKAEWSEAFAYDFDKGKVTKSNPVVIASLNFEASKKYNVAARWALRTPVRRGESQV